MKINFVGGSGVMGQVHIPIFRKAGHEVIVSGRNSTVSLEDAAKESDLTLVSVPIHATEEIIKRVAPYSKAIMDLTGLKQFPLEAMLNYSPMKSEVAGLHPLYGPVKSINGKTLIYCKTERTGERCEELVDVFRNAKAKIKVMTPEKHDLIPAGYGQNLRLMLLEAFGTLLSESGMSLEEFYQISPPPTRIILDLLARQIDEKNDKLYEDMLEYNPFTPIISAKLITQLQKANSHANKEKIRAFYGTELEKAKQRAAKLIK